MNASLGDYSTQTKEVVIQYPPQVRYSLPLDVGGAILLYLILFCVSFIVLITFNPSFLNPNPPPGTDPQPNFGNCLITSLIASLVLCIIIWLFLCV